MASSDWSSRAPAPHRSTLDAEALPLGQGGETFDDLVQEMTAHAEQQLVMTMQEVFCLPIERRQFLEGFQIHYVLVTDWM
jgi:hypothetical protein